MRSEYSGNIQAVREVEDCIRATKKYTKGVFSRAKQHPVQGQDFPSKMITEYYEVYPDFDLGQIKPLWDAILDTSDWLWGEVIHIDVIFKYDYRTNKAFIIIRGNKGVVDELSRGIPNFSEAMSRVNGTKPA